VRQLQQRRRHELQQPAEHWLAAPEGGQLGRHLLAHHHDLSGDMDNKLVHVIMIFLVSFDMEN
jgi:hypothetical protein